LAEYALWDHAIDLELRMYPRFFLMYKFTETKNQALKKFVKKNLKLRKIKPSTSLIKYPILFTPKKKQEAMVMH